ncbi:2,3-dihydroxybenzoate-AMP ligase [Corynebacterium gerontici]|uniref:2,3-dihydroxybenzoate-AMP ligase n=1 Tax=Corynebacterium gerontici TaxID=2079234 RepID=A0A3G6J236_9CORY|nr:2,3-dihydroxybenzoate-AMP ligase [Corynebacterium gerontici]
MSQPHAQYPKKIPQVQIPAPGSLYPSAFEIAYREAGYWTEETFSQLAENLAARFGDAEALVGQDCTGNAVRLSYRDLFLASNQRAETLLEAGIRESDRVVVQLPNIVEYLIDVLALFRIGALPVFALIAHRRSEIEHFINASGARAFITTTAHAGYNHSELALKLSQDYPELVTLIHDGSFNAEEHQIDVPASSVAANAVAFLQVSGGTTGLPKLIPRTHADYLYSVRASANICALDRRTRFLVALPASHNFTMSSPGILGVLHAGGTVVFTLDPSPTAVADVIEAEGITMTAAVPPLAMTWMNIIPLLQKDISSLEVLQVGGAKFPPEAARRVSETLGCKLQQVFGMAEGLVNYTRLDDEENRVIHTQGRPISPDDEILVVDDAGAEYPQESAGIC